MKGWLTPKLLLTAIYLLRKHQKGILTRKKMSSINERGNLPPVHYPPPPPPPPKKKKKKKKKRKEKPLPNKISCHTILYSHHPDNIPFWKGYTGNVTVDNIRFFFNESEIRWLWWALSYIWKRYKNIIPTGTWHNDNVITSKRRRDVVLT